MVTVTSTSKNLSSELIVAREILRLEKMGQTPHFEALLNATGLDATLLSKALDILFDQGLLTTKWVKLPTGKFVRDVQVAGEARGFVQYLLDNT